MLLWNARLSLYVLCSFDSFSGVVWLSDQHTIYWHADILIDFFFYLTATTRKQVNSYYIKFTFIFDLLSLSERFRSVLNSSMERETEENFVNKQFLDMDVKNAGRLSDLLPSCIHFTFVNLEFHDLFLDRKRRKHFLVYREWGFSLFFSVHPELTGYYLKLNYNHFLPRPFEFNNKHSIH